MRHCPVCDSEMSPRFASECEPPVAWACLECGLLQLESGGRPFTPEQAEAVAALAPAVSSRRSRPASAAAAQAREILDTFGADVPVDVEALAQRLGFAVQWRSLPGGVRGTVGGEEGHRVLVLNRDYPFRTEAERRWAVAEELAHAVLGHGTLVASEEPGGPPALQEPARRAREREARAFAAELLMPAARVRQAFAREQAIILRALGTQERAEAVRTVVADLAREFRVSQQAMRLRLAELGLLA
ncbi:MAG: ImmA/IrrE family metallo-endopeptidase [Armatimonadota bacterium]|nr:ImmA/IrrE family metallo-endopeptidase [Armatimonadota bacterium]MDR7436138.1 ImmA/IrrE family metallo-endopeptidase [Armatimonadota bacterium]MDR7472017.1 ImmA/IrrE family metallo-endopeptidase [Armatimonadota bacterium]MDR7508673.1 ImmA/IrrE family metallo-endopeptidase [Armatimonadota bacterium]MDR7517038.1 ImmA/IrrE family metallo-endopeptidase [Armatimonadota bacterium]